MSLRDRAADLAGRIDEPADNNGWPAAPQPGTAPAAIPAPEPEQLPDIDVDEPGPDGPEQVPVHVAWSRVMGEIRRIGKHDNYNGGGTRYNFRGVDRTVNAFAPALRKHGVLVMPVSVDASYRDTKTSKGNAMRECTVRVKWMVVGPAGDTLPQLLESAGEALDSADKGTAKAQSVALRVLLLTAGMVPTGDPDPDSVHVERGEAPIRPAASYRDEALDTSTSRQRLRQMFYEVQQQRRSGETVVNETGDEEPIGTLITRIGKERFGGGGE